MTDASTLPEHNASDPRAVAERQVAILGEMAEAGLQIVMALRDRALGDQAPADAGPTAQDIGLAYARVSRAVRLTLALQAKVLVETLDTLDRRAAWAVDHPLPKPPAPPRPEMVRRERVQRVVERVIAAEHDHEPTIERLAGESWERLVDEDLYGDVLGRPMSELVARICADLGLSPDWTRLAQEAWAQEEIQGGAAGAPLARAASAAPTPAGGGAARPTAALHAASP